jgi:hypothetical protein
MSAFREHEERIRAARLRRLSGREIRCPGCGTEIHASNVGGYRTFCNRCVEAFPKFPDAPGGYNIEGRYPSFRWKGKATEIYPTAREVKGQQ